MKTLLHKISKPLLFTLTGAGVGYAFYHFFGCTNGCAITSNPWLTTAMGGLLGLTMAAPDEKKKGE